MIWRNLAGQSKAVSCPAEEATTLSDDHSTAWSQRYQQCLRFVDGVASAVESGRKVALGPTSESMARPAATGAAVSVSRPATKVVYCAPHPDDESLSGVLALRLRLESGSEVTNVAITLGSEVSQRARRRRELESACSALGFGLVIPSDPSGATPEAGFERLNLTTKQARPGEWSAKVETLREIFDRENPDLVFAPHAEDFNTTHIGTHWLVVEALGAHLERAGRGPATLTQTEFWHQLAEPNLMVGVSRETLADLLVAATEHGGEMRRNPYHLLAPARMMDNVRRGSEVVGGQGAQAQDFTFAELYRVTFMRGRELITPRPGGFFVGPAERIDAAILKARFWPEG